MLLSLKVWFLWNHTNWIFFFFPFLILLSMMWKATQVNGWIFQSIYRMIDTYFATSEAGNVMHSLRSLAFLWQLLNSGERLEQQKSFGCFWNPGYPTVGNHSSFADDTDLLTFKDEACCFFGEMFKLLFSTEPLCHAVSHAAWLILSLG